MLFFSASCTNTYRDLKCAGIQCDFLTNIEVFHGIKLFIIWWRKWNTMTTNQGSCWRQSVYQLLLCDMQGPSPPFVVY